MAGNGNNGSSGKAKPKRAFRLCKRCGCRKEFRYNEKGELACKGCGSAFEGGKFDNGFPVKRAKGRACQQGARG